MTATPGKTHCDVCYRPIATAQLWAHEHGCECEACKAACWGESCWNGHYQFVREMADLLLELHEYGQVPERYTSAARVAELATRIKGARG